jgi:hypothetical protein
MPLSHRAHHGSLQAIGVQCPAFSPEKLTLLAHEAPTGDLSQALLGRNTPVDETISTRDRKGRRKGTRVKEMRGGRCPARHHAAGPHRGSRARRDARAATPTQREELTELKKPGEDKVEDKVNIFKHPWPTTKSHPKLMPSKLE